MSMTSRFDPPMPTALTLGMSFVAGAAITAGLAWVAGRWQRRPASDELVARRVRAHAATVLSEPGAVSVEVDQGVVRVAGRLTADERERFLTTLLEVPGVSRVRNALAVLPASAAS